MKKKRKIKRVFHVLILLVILSAGISFSSPAKVDAKEFFFTLETGYFSKYELSVNAGDYLNLLKNQLAQIGINLDITVWDYPPYYPLKLFCWGRDLFFLSLNPSENEVDPNFFTKVYGENGSLNFFRYDESLDWDSTLVLDGRTGVPEAIALRTSFISCLSYFSI